MKTTTKVWLIIGFLILLPACQRKPEFINHTPPNLTVSMDVFPEDSLLADLGCSEIQAASSMLGGLNPAYPIAVCAIQYRPDEVTEELAAEIDSGQFFYYTGGLSGNYVRYVVYQEGEIVLLKTEEDLRKLFAPVESPEEALSFVLAAKNLSAAYGFQYDPAYVYDVDKIEDTYVRPDADGYLVHVFHDQPFGCGQHWTSEVDVHVSANGTIEERSGRQIFRDPGMDDVCVD